MIPVKVPRRFQPSFPPAPSKEYAAPNCFGGVGGKLSSNAVLTSGINRSVGVGQAGKAWVGDIANNGDINSVSGILTTQFSILAYARFDSLGTKNAIIDRDINTRRCFQFYKSTTDKLECVRFNTTVSSIITITSTKSIVANTPTPVALVVNGNNFSIFIGTEKVSGATTGTPQSWDGIVGIGASWVGTAGNGGFPGGDKLPGMIFSYLATPRVLSDGAVKKFLSQPYSIYPDRRIWVPVSVAASGTAALTGNAATSAVGSLPPSITLGINGNQATASSGTVSVAAGSTAALTGNSATGSAGTLTPSESLATSGNQATGAQGAVSASLSLATTGNQATASTGAAVASLSVGLTGQAATASAGTISVQGVSGAALVGNAATTAAGTPAPFETLATSGNQATGTVGTASPVVSLGVTGQQATAAVGSLVASITVGLAGNAATGSVGAVGVPTGDITIGITGNGATSAAGSVGIGSASVGGGSYDDTPKNPKKKFFAEVDGKLLVFNTARAAVAAVNASPDASEAPTSARKPKPVASVSLPAVEAYAEASGQHDDYLTALNNKHFTAILKMFSDMEDEDDVEMLLLSL